MIDKKMEILKAGRLLFTEKGFKDTNVSEITKKAGIATGTYYNYYTSKDNLFMDIYLEENVKLKNKIMSEIDLNGQPMEVMAKMMHLNEKGMRNNPILKEWYNQDVFSRIEKVYREETGVDRVDFMYDSFIEVIRKWQDEGIMRTDIDAEMIRAIFSALISVDTHKEDVGVQYFPNLMNYLAEFIMKGLMDIT
jgi:AcrR family transcriptional regulator